MARWTSRAVASLGIVAGVAALLGSIASGPGHAAAGPQAEAQTPSTPELVRPVRGMTISCWGWGAEWAAPGFDRSLADLAAIGVNAAAIHPYGWISSDGAIRHRQRLDDPTVLRPLADIRRRGMRSMLKPHLGYWGSKFSWRGEITFDDEARWRRFFDDYEDFIVTQARLAERGQADLFCVGTELKGTLHREEDWRRIIAAVRKVYDGPLTYAANWDSVGDVPFWDALDQIGVQGYFPLSEEDQPTDAQLHAGWDRALKSLGELAEKHDRPVLFTEAGYARSNDAARRPWHSETDPDPAAERLKQRCLHIALHRLAGEGRPDWLLGVYLWKWFPTDRTLDREFLLQYPGARAVIRSAWGDRPASPRETAPLITID